MARDAEDCVRLVPLSTGWGEGRMSHTTTRDVVHVHVHVHVSSPTRGSSFFLGKVTALGVLCCFALLFV